MGRRGRAGDYRGFSGHAGLRAKEMTPLTKCAAMLRRTFAFVAILSVVAFVAVAVCAIREHFASDDFGIISWNPATRQVREFRMSWREGGVSTHTESTIALASDNISLIRAKAGAFNLRFVHDSFVRSSWIDCPILWGDHYRCTPLLGVNRNGLSDCWTLEFRLNWALAALAVLPLLWVCNYIQRVVQRRRCAAPGFAVIEIPPANC
jgi:hypothetical protein